MFMYKQIIAALALALTVPVSWADDNAHYEVTITNLTRGTLFTPFVVATHRQGVQLFTAGKPASPALSRLAESGETAPLIAVLRADKRVKDVRTTNGPLNPGQTVTINVDTADHFDRVSLAAMMVPTNDGFVPLNGVPGPRGNDPLVYTIAGHDAGSEPNDELCGNIPGPTCGGIGNSPEAGGEDYVHIHAGIHGIGDLAADEYDWRNPVAVVRIRRVE